MAAWNDPKETRFLGRDVPRVDGPAKASGRAVYPSDVRREAMLYAAVLRSPHAHAKVVDIGTAKAEALPGVRAVHVLATPGTALRYQGQEIAAVAADTLDHAQDAVAAIRIEYEPYPFTVRTEVAAKDQANRSRPDVEEEGDAGEALAGSAARVEAEYSVPVRLHSCLEPHAAVVEWTADDSFTAWLSTQGVHQAAAAMSANQDVPSGNARVLCDVMGGGFGSKLSPSPTAALAATLAKKAGAPVKLVTDRRGEQLAMGNGPDAFARVTAGADAEGRLTGVRAALYGTPGHGKRWSMPFPYVYQVPARRVERSGVQTNCGPQAPLRAPMHPQACAITEAVLDELAAALKMDPLELRLKNLGSTPQDDVRRQQFRRGAELIGWARRSTTPGADTGRRRRGLGVATGRWDVPGASGTRVDVQIHPDGMVDVAVGTQDLGTGTRTWVAAIVAEDLGLPLERVRPRIGDSRLGFAPGSGGSRTAPSVAPAVKQAALEARAQLFRKVAPLLKAQPDELEAVDERIRVRHDPTRTLEFVDACARVGASGIAASGGFDDSLAQAGVAGVQFAEVEVDTWTGRVRPIRIVAVHDCGYVLDKLTAESQIIGGVIQGIGMALLEERKMDEQTGRCVNPNLEFYRLPGMAELPEIVPILVETHRKVSGIGEPPVIPTAAAIANAVHNAIGVRVRHLPMTPRRIIEALS
jgi:xanthine dehydrogenase YagR molybdenum-binding subunit